MLQPLTRRGWLLAAFALIALPAWPATVFKQPGFSQSVVFTGLSSPTAVRFLPDGRVLIAEKSGLIQLFDGLTDQAPSVVADLRRQVHNFWDRGLLGLAVDPAFPDNGFIYVLYTHDAPIGGTAPTWGPGDGTSDPCPSPPGATTDGCVVSGRLSRMVAHGADWSASEEVLIEGWCQQFPSHSMGALAFGADGYLYLSAGEGANFFNADWGQFGGSSGTPPPTPRNPCGDPPVAAGGVQQKPWAEGGALRSQSPHRAAGEPRVLSGTLLRVDPATGDAAPDNPFARAGSSDANERRILGYGLRNPFRFTVRPGTSDVWVADVGWDRWEELNRIADHDRARNFGWPCFEGPDPGYTGHTLCLDLDQVTPPLFAYAQDTALAPGDGCPASGGTLSGLAFYPGGGNWPASYDGALLLADYARSCMWVMFPGADGLPDPGRRAPFASGVPAPVDLEPGPDGNLYYVDLDGGRVLRIVYGLHAVATASVTAGGVPLAVELDGRQSQPARPGEALLHAWDLDGDGDFDDASGALVSWVYQEPGTHTARLRVTDPEGASDVSAVIRIEAGAGRPAVTISSPRPGTAWKVGDPIAFAGEASDPEDGVLPASALEWRIRIHHCGSDCHAHPFQSFSGTAAGSFAAPDHEYPAFLELELGATDGDGNVGTARLSLLPQTVDLSLRSVPSGLELAAGSFAGPTPASLRAIVGSRLSVAAPSPQGAPPEQWELVSWSDGGAPSHIVTAPPTPATLTARFATRADLVLEASAVPVPTCAGEPLSFRLSVRNAGPSRATVLELGDTLPTGAALESVSAPGWSCDAASASGVVACTRPALEVGATGTVTVVARVPVPAASAVNRASLSSAAIDPASGNNTVELATAVLAPPAAPVVSAPESLPVGSRGAIASAPRQTGATYQWSVTGGELASGQGSPAITFDAGPPGTTMSVAAVALQDGCGSAPATRRVQVDFLDAAPGHPFHDFITTLARNGVTAGCGGGRFCPDLAATRGQMAAFLLRSRFGREHVPPPATGRVFRDVPAGDPLAGWIEELAALGITGGCGSGNFCPQEPVTRAQVAIFLLRTLLGAGHQPPPASGIFTDVPAGSFAADWIEELRSRSIASGCASSPPRFCPGAAVTRGQMAVFLTRTFALD